MASTGARRPAGEVRRVRAPMGRSRGAGSMPRARPAPGAVGAWLCLLMLLACVSAAAASDDPSCGVVAIPLRTDGVVYRLPHGFIRARSDSAWTRSGPWLRGRDYALEPFRGEVRLLRTPVAGDTLWVASCWLLSPPPTALWVNRYRSAAPGRPAGADSATGASDVSPRPVTAHSTTAAPSGAALTVNGNKTLAVDFGSNQDATLRQSLDLAVSGTLAPGVQVTGVLSDRNVPLTTGGSTQDIQSLDRVLLQVTAPNGSAALGDVAIDLQPGEFARLTRRAQGVLGEWSVGDFHGVLAAANAQGEYHRLQFFGVDGQQGPYVLTDRNGGTGVSVVANSEVVTVDGVRMTRGESADYAMDYERARVTFTNRRPISSASRITVDYQFTANRFRRNLSAVGGRWEHGALYGFTQLLTEGDDRGRPLEVTLSADDRRLLAAAGDSADRALGTGVVAGPGDYDSVRVDSATTAFAFAGPGAGHFMVAFTHVGPGLGAYADSGVVAGRQVFRFVGRGAGEYQVGRPLPLPESQQLWSGGAGVHAGPLAVEVEGAFSRHDVNTFSSLDDRDNQGAAGRARVGLEGALPGVFGRGGLALQARSVAPRFASFTRLEAPFEQEDWGLPVSGDVEHQRRIEATAFVAPRSGGRLDASLGRLDTPDGFASVRQTIAWVREGALATRAQWAHADGHAEGVRFDRGGRDHALGELRVRLPWLEPGVRVESDERHAPSDTGRAGVRFREGGVELRSAQALRWHALAGWSVRRDALDGPAGFVAQGESRTLRLGLDSPEGGRLGGALLYQRRALAPLADPRRTRSDLASVRVRGEDPRRGIKGQLNVEITTEGENRRVRSLVFVGTGLGAYDALGNFVGTGDYDLVVTIRPELDRLSRAATSARLEAPFGSGEAWRGSRVEFGFESDARRRGELRLQDPFVSPGATLGDGALARASVQQRIEAELAPGSAAAAFHVRAERRVNGDRTFENFGQTTDERLVSARWRTRPAPAWSTEVVAQLRRQDAVQALAGGAGFARTLREQSGTAQLVFTPDARLRAVGVVAAAWSRPAGQALSTRTLTVGPDVGLALGARGHADLGAHRAFISGPPQLALLPTADPVGAPRWEGTVRVDYRVRDASTLGLTFVVRERPGKATQATGRAELRAFF